MTAGDISDTANDHANIINFHDINRIELLKGPSALRYGPYATSGVVNSFNRLLEDDVESATEISVGGGTSATVRPGPFMPPGLSTTPCFRSSDLIRKAKNIEIPTHAESALELIEEGEAIVDVSQDVENTSSETDGISASLLFKGTKSNLRLFAPTSLTRNMAFLVMHTMKKKEKERAVKKSTAKKALKSARKRDVSRLTRLSARLSF